MLGIRLGLRVVGCRLDPTNPMVHRCEMHRNDPETHSSKKGVKGIQRKQQIKKLEKEGTWGSKRKAPITTRNEATPCSNKKRRKAKDSEENLTSHARRVVHAYPPGKVATDKLKRKLEEKNEDGKESEVPKMSEVFKRIGEIIANQGQFREINNNNIVLHVS